MAGRIKATRETGDARLASRFEYDVCLSFAGEDRDYVRQVARELRSRGVRIFYDEYEVERLWGQDLYEHLDYVYGKAARFCILFASKHYAKKVWTSHERKSAQARALKENVEYVLPARFDSTSIPGLRESVGYIDLRRYKPHDFAILVIRKLAPFRLLEFHSMENYFPPNPDILFSFLKARLQKRPRHLVFGKSRLFPGTLPNDKY
jgi:TIR domain-containing protein